MKRILPLLVLMFALASCMGDHKQDAVTHQEASMQVSQSSEVSQNQESSQLWDTNTASVVMTLESATGSIKEENVIDGVMELGVHPGNQAMQTSLDESVNQLFN